MHNPNVTALFQLPIAETDTIHKTSEASRKAWEKRRAGTPPAKAPTKAHAKSVAKPKAMSDAAEFRKALDEAFGVKRQPKSAFTEKPNGSTSAKEAKDRIEWASSQPGRVKSSGGVHSSTDNAAMKRVKFSKSQFDRDAYWNHTNGGTGGELKAIKNAVAYLKKATGFSSKDATAFLQDYTSSGAAGKLEMARTMLA